MGSDVLLQTVPHHSHMENFKISLETPFFAQKSGKPAHYVCPSSGDGANVLCSWSASGGTGF